MDYPILTLVGGHKLYSMELFFKYILELNIQPKEIVISCTPEIFGECILAYSKFDCDKPPLKWVHGLEDKGDDMIYSTTSAREALRQYFLSKTYEWSLWLDNDMLVPSNMIDKFQRLLEMDPELLYVNAFHPARQQEGKLRHGLGSSFIHRKVMMIHPFTYGILDGKYLGEDYLWKMIVNAFFNIYKQFKPLTTVFIEEKGIGRKIRCWHHGICILVRPKYVALISNTES